MGRYAGLLAVLLLGMVGNGYAEEGQSCLDWLKTVAFAGHQTDYSGVFVYQYDNHVETSSITHVVEKDGEYEKIESLDGPKREIIRHHGEVWSYINHQMVQVDSQQGRKRFPSLLPEQLTALGENYQARRVGAERVAGYNAQVLLFKPRDNFRYTHKLWVHTDSGLLLKAAVLDDKEQVVEQYAFTQLQIGGAVDHAWLKQVIASTGKSAPPDKTAGKQPTPVNSGWVVDTLPTGFRKSAEILRPMRGKHRPVTQIVYSDGLSAISLFIEENDKDEDDVEGLSSRGSVSIYHKVVDRHLLTVVGEVPPRTVMKVFDSARYNGN